MKQIAIFGAFDRFNYGDLLFPLIIEKALKEYSTEYEFNYYATTNSDLRNVGGKPTKSVEQLLDPGQLENGSIVIIAGGEVLGPCWYDIYGCLGPEYLLSLTREITKSLPNNELRKIKPKIHGKIINQPFILSPKDFSTHVQIFYNAVGGSGLTNGEIPVTELYEILLSLGQADFISVRDRKTYLNLMQLGINKIPIVTPDSASIMSVYYPVLELDKRIGGSVLAWVEKYRNNYLSFQIAHNYAKQKGNIDQITHMLEAIYKEFKLPIALCPIGTAAHHEDQIPLELIFSNAQCPTFFLSKPTVFDIMSLIANSRVFMGTSLHGAITAMSFAIPNIALTKRVKKLDEYLDTWSLPELNESIPLSSMLSSVDRALRIGKEHLELKREEIIEKTMESFNIMKQSIGQAKNYSFNNRNNPNQPFSIILRPYSISRIWIGVFLCKKVNIVKKDFRNLIRRIYYYFLHKAN